jgi:hypothetical protein
LMVRRHTGRAVFASLRQPLAKPEGLK